MSTGSDRLDIAYLEATNAGQQGRPSVRQGPLEAFDMTIRDINERRGADYGHPFDNFTRIARLKAVIADCPDPLIRHVLDELAVKISRLIETPDHIDSLIDIAGYARTGAMVLDRKLQSKIQTGKSTS